jgi:glycosyltransferase involved in cell wall biosynthesis
MARIAFLLPDFTVGGAEQVALSLIKSFVKRGAEVDLVLLRAEGELLSELPAEVHVVSLRAKRLRSALGPFIRYLQERTPDVVHARMWPLTLVPIVARLLLGSRLRLLIAEDSILSHAYAGRGFLHRLALRGSIGMLYPLADARVAVSNGAADDLAGLGGLDRGSITVLHNPVALPRPHEGCRDIDWGGGGVRILAVGNLIPVKNFSLLFSAFARLIELRPARLLVVGEGPERSRLESLATELGIRDFVTMPGFIPNPGPYYESAEVLVMSSNNEAFPGVLIEALHYGLTAVSTDCPTGPREILDGGRYGYLTPTGDSQALFVGIARACDRPFPGKVLRARADELSGPHVIDRYWDLLLAPIRR